MTDEQLEQVSGGATKPAASPEKKPKRPDGGEEKVSGMDLGSER